MIKNLSRIEIAVGERVYHFLCEVDAPIGEVHDALMQMKGFVIQKMQDIQAAQNPVPVKTEDKSNAV
jgi:hypothetical protein